MYAMETLIICCQAMGSQLIQPAVQAIIVHTWQQAHDALLLQPSTTITIQYKQHNPVCKNHYD